jgi:hypothetical protein
MKLLIYLCCLTMPIFSGFNSTQLHFSVSDEEKRKKISQEIVNNLVKEDYEAVRKDFHVSLKTNLPVEKIAEAWQNLIQMTGSFEKVITTIPAETNGYHQVRIRCKFKNDNATVETTFNEDDKVFGLWLKP